MLTEKDTVRYYYNESNQLIRTEGAFPEKSYQYDARGNMITILQGAKITNRYIYDETNHLSVAINSNGLAAKYLYDGLDNRIGMQEYATSGMKLEEIFFAEDKASREVEYVLDLTRQYCNLLEQNVSAGKESIVQTYVWDNNVVFMTEGENSHIYLQDEMGSTLRVVGGADTKQTLYGYDEFGQDLYDTQGIVQPFGFAGYQRDNIAGAYFTQAKRYLPEIGRYCGKDQERGIINFPKVYNAYSYCFNYSINSIDMEGRFLPWPNSNIVGSQWEKTMPSEAEPPYPHALTVSPFDYRDADTSNIYYCSCIFNLGIWPDCGQISTRKGLYGSKSYDSATEIKKLVLKDMRDLGREIGIINSPNEKVDGMCVIEMVKTLTSN